MKASTTDTPSPDQTLARMLRRAGAALLVAGCVAMAGCVSVTSLQVLTSDSAADIQGGPTACASTEPARRPQPFTAPLAALDPNEISVLNWNIYKGQRDNWAGDFGRFSLRQDIVIIQEAHLDDKLKNLLSENNLHWNMNAAFYYNDSAAGVMTAASIEPIYSCGMRFAEPLIRIPKSTLVSYYPIDGMEQTLLVANIHGINFTFGTDAYAEQVNALRDVVRRHRGPVIVAGDFNSWSDARMAIVQAMVDDLGLASLEYRNHNRTRWFGQAIDHVFYRGLEPLSQHAWRVTSSDHNPISVSFRVSGAELASK